jgi:primosomal protein N' (replication factor Y)
MEKRCAEVAVPIPTAKSYRYSIPRQFEHKVDVGSSVLVNFHGRRLVGWVIGFVDNEKEGLKPIMDVVEARPMFTPKMLEFFRWLSEYYLSPIGLVIRSGLPGGVAPKERQNCLLISEPSHTGRLSSRIIAYLKENAGKTSLGAITRKFGKDSLKEINSLSRAGNLRIERELISPRVKVKRARWIRLVGKPKKATSAQEKVLGLLEEKGEASVADIKNILNVGFSVIRTLENRGVVQSFHREEFRDSLSHLFVQKNPLPHLTKEQARIMKRVSSKLKSGGFGVVLIHGVTGSGKTELYLSAIEKALEMGKSAIFLVPEIFLTAQFTSILLDRFGNACSEYHSALGAGEQYDAWRRMRDGDVKIVIGPRSALFAPLPNLGVIIVDEEHERTFKQSDLVPRYNARDTAIIRARQEDALCILGSATPSLESYHNATRRKYELVHLPRRIGKRKLPTVTIVDMRNEKSRVLSELLKSKIQDRLTRSEQIILFMNRRGYSNFLQCRDCGSTLRCPSCSVTLTYHRIPRVLRCHYCGYERNPPDVCEDCRGANMTYMGFGTQRIEEELNRNFPGVRVLRVDLDTTTLKGSHLVYFRKFKNREADLLLGTQMVAKGLDFPWVTLVGVVSADSSLNLPDFRSSERTFQLLTQVAGRAGRGAMKGEVVIQTFSPSYYAIGLSRTHAYEDFFLREIEERKSLQYPPFSRLAAITMKSKRLEECEALAHEIKERLQTTTDISILGPAPCVLSRVKGYYRYRIILKSKKDLLIQKVIREALPEYVRGRDRRVNIDIDPVDLL